MKIEDVELNRIYYFQYTNKKTPSILVPIRIRKSDTSVHGHFWTESYFYDSYFDHWYYHSGNWTIGSPSFEELETIDNKIIYKSIMSLFDKKIVRYKNAH